jgi:hypothetical protein
MRRYGHQTGPGWLYWFVVLSGLAAFWRAIGGPWPF